MAIRIIRLGDPRLTGEGIRIGTVRRPPRGVPKSEFASRNFYDSWLPELAPSEELLKIGQAVADDKAWSGFLKRYRREMNRPEAKHLLDFLAALSHHTNFSVGCYCPEEERCHRSELRKLLAERGSELAG